MLALAWPWGDETHAYRNDLSQRLACSLCAGIGGHAGKSEINGIYTAFRSLRSTVASARAWRPALLNDGSIVIFHGYFDNAAEISDLLGADSENLPFLYGLAVKRWSDEADAKIIGEYCAVVARPDRKFVRLARSPLRAPPLCYFHNDQLVVTASVPRALFAVGVGRRINEERLADSAMLNFTNHEAGWFVDVSRVPLGSVVELTIGKPRSLKKYYDPLCVPTMSYSSDDELIDRANELLNDGVKACLAGFQNPSATLSGGLDSPQVAVRALANLPAGQRLPTFTFHTQEGFDGRVEPWFFADDRPLVESFTAMHPRLEPHYTANVGYEHDYRLNDFFHLMGGAPAGLCNMYVFHGLFRGAQERGCDLLLVSDWGNETFSADGSWAFVEYLRKGRFKQYWQALARLPASHGSMLRRFLAKSAMPLLPHFLWRLVRQVVFPKRLRLIDYIEPLRPDFRVGSGAERRYRANGPKLDRFEPISRKHARRLRLERGDFEQDEIYQAFEQMYGIAQRDPTAYRPFVEFCLGLPTRMFMRDGESRWLARQMARGIMPEYQRLNPLHGRWDADWHLRMTRRRRDYIAELDRFVVNDRVASIVDIPRLRAALENWPERTPADRYEAFSREMAVPRGLLTARFINYSEGRNN